MKCPRNRRGSVLLMAIGLLTIIAILASTFLIVSNLDAEEEMILSTKSQADPIAEGAFAAVLAMAYEDKHIGAASDGEDAPYGGIWGDGGSQATGAEAWEKYIDGPGTGVGDDGRIDEWLSTPYGYHGDPCTPIRSPFTKINDDTHTGGTRTDTDGDGQKDALIYKPYRDVSDSQKEGRFRAAVRVIDLGGKICVNTAGYAPTSLRGSDAILLPLSWSPATTDLKGFLSAKPGGNDPHGRLYGELHGKRCEGTPHVVPEPTCLRNFDSWCGRRLLFPRTDYTPFSIGDELFLLWGEHLDENMDANVNAGRLAELLHDTLIEENQADASWNRWGDEKRRRLTTFSCTGARVRHPRRTGEPDSTHETLQYIDTQSLLYDRSTQDAVYERMRRMLEEVGVGTSVEARNRMAGHFTANLMAYVAPTRVKATTGRPWHYQYKLSAVKPVTAYGVKQDIVITEVYVKHYAHKEAGDANMFAWGCAIELMNPCDANVPLSDFELEVDGNTIPLNTTLIPPVDLSAADPGATANTYGKFVLWNFDQGQEKDANGNWQNHTTPEEFFPFDITQDNFGRVPGLDLGGEGTRHLSLRRIYSIPDDPNDMKVAVDRVVLGPEGNTKSELLYERSKDLEEFMGDSSTEAEPVIRNIRRDDRWHIIVDPLDSKRKGLRARYNIAVWRESTPDTEDNTIGTDNVDGVSVDDWLLGGPRRPAAGSAVYSAAIYEAARRHPDTTMPVLLMDSIGDLGNVYFCGPSSESDKGFPQRIMDQADSEIFSDNPARGRLDYCPKGNVKYGVDADPNDASGKYPDVPVACLVSEFFTHVQPHDRTLDAPDSPNPYDKERVYGLINVNSAPPAVLAGLPWPQRVRGQFAADEAYEIDEEEVVDYLLRYREDPGMPSDPNGPGVPQLRDAQGSRNIKAYLTPGELAVPLAAYMDTVMSGHVEMTNEIREQLRRRADYLWTRNALYRRVANCVTTRSDVFAVYIKVQYGTVGRRMKWHYIGVFDRSNVLKKGDSPAILMFTQINAWEQD